MSDDAPDRPDDGPAPMAELRALLHDAQDAARRVREQAEEARAAATDEGAAPPGWSTAEERRERIDEVHAVVQVVRTLREVVPDDLRAQVAQLLHNLLALARALIDWWIERLEGSGDPAVAPDDRDPDRGSARRPEEPGGTVQDIPIG
ncbi:MAG: hypothetical protein M0P31_12160 [Solirubrobacteraceae bacterium]|nr:hypothetical protein [Solirubrobacteraceae bacterium]